MILTVKQLIQELQRHPEDAIVIGVRDGKPVELERIEEVGTLDLAGNPAASVVMIS